MGTDHAFTLAARTELADAYGAAGNLQRAIPLLEQTVADRERENGPDHPAALQARVLLAGLRQMAADYPQAIAAFEQLLAHLERVLGPTHPSTLTTRNNLAATYQAAGNLDRAIPLLEQALAERERVLSSDHPGTLSSRNSLAQAYQAGPATRSGDPPLRAGTYRSRTTARRRPPPYCQNPREPNRRPPADATATATYRGLKKSSRHSIVAARRLRIEATFQLWPLDNAIRQPIPELQDLPLRRGLLDELWVGA